MYVDEMKWLHAAGVISCYADYEALDVRVLEDCRLVREAEMIAVGKAQHEAKHGRR
jgi:hypothetical protein